MKKIVYKTETGIAIITPAHGIVGAMKDIPKGVEYKIIEDTELLQDRTYHNAWTYDLKIDAVKKVEIDAEIAETVEKEAMPDLVKSLEIQITSLNNKVKTLEEKAVKEVL